MTIPQAATASYAVYIATRRPAIFLPYHTNPSQIQLGQFSVNPPRLVLEVGGTSTKQAAMPGELKSPPTWNLEVGGTSTLQA